MKAGLAIAIVLGGVAPARAQELPAVSIQDVIVDEGDKAGFDIVVRGGILGSAEVEWRTEALSADNSADFAPRQGTIIFTPSGPPSARIEIQILGDQIGEGSEAFLVRLTGATNVEIADAVGYGVIRDGTAGRTRCDQTGDGHSDILVQFAEGDTPAPYPHGLPHDRWSPQSSIIPKMDTIRGSHWLIEAVGDFDGNGTCDLLWSPPEHPHICHTPEPFLPHELVVTEADVIPEDCRFLFRVSRPAEGWQIAGSDDTNANGVADLLWWDPISRSLHLSLRLPDPSTDLPVVVVPVDGCMTASWSPAGLGRLSAGPIPDLLGYDGNGGFVYWAMSWTDGVFSCQAEGDLRVPTGGSLAAVGDFDSDGFDDLLWQGPPDPIYAEGRITAHFVRARVVVASSPLRFQSADISGRRYRERRFAGPR